MHAVTCCSPTDIVDVQHARTASTGEPRSESLHNGRAAQFRTSV